MPKFWDYIHDDISGKCDRNGGQYRADVSHRTSHDP